MENLIGKSLCQCPVLPKDVKVKKYEKGSSRVETNANCFKDFLLAMAISKSCTPIERC